ncbi:hypothetical protein RJ639_035203 [Escallonia herrerae]|uniref:ApaG domain-containing protein n=1 Tax=Escallonia herrerae TaxID=1293975 RepID=A0AA88WQD8_9ASTE|nr:hypothetical protein RJ639_035203 [Escallonia herrerae]
MELEIVGALAIHTVLSKLSPRDVAMVACVSKGFRTYASENSLWSLICANELCLSSPQDSLGNLLPSFKEAYQAWREAFGMYPWSLVRRVIRFWSRIKSWLAANFPEAVPTLRKGVTEDEIKELEKSLKVKLPLPTRLVYRFCDGQELPSEECRGSMRGSLLGLIGGYTFYTHQVNVFLLPLKQVILETKDIIRHLGFSSQSKYLVVAASCTNDEKFFFLNCANGQLYVGTANLISDGEMIPCVPNGLISSVHDPKDSQQQDAMLLWLEEHVRRLEGGIIKVREEGKIRGINLFPEQPPQCSTAVTNGVQVRASAVFVPEASDLQSEYEKFMFSYSIRMCLLPPGCVIRGMSFGSCQLYWRHWIIRAHDNVESDVNGEAVIGKVGGLPQTDQGECLLINFEKPTTNFNGQSCMETRGWLHNASDPFPLLSPGDNEFVYESCTPLRSSPGSVEGSFTFVPGSLADPKGGAFRVEVARFPLQFPDYIF